MGRMEATSSILMVAIVSCLMIQSTNALIHVVGGDYGWDIPPTPNFYCQWASPRKFGVGDELVFPYRPVSEDIYQVSKEDYDHCSLDHVINQWIMGPTRISLDTPGDYYFFSSVGTHCEMGQKLHIVVGQYPGSDGINWDEVVRQRAPTIHSQLSFGHHAVHILHQPIIHKSLSVVRHPFRTGSKRFPTTVHPFIKRKLLSDSSTQRSEESLA